MEKTGSQPIDLLIGEEQRAARRCEHSRGGCRKRAHHAQHEQPRRDSDPPQAAAGASFPHGTAESRRSFERSCLRMQVYTCTASLPGELHATSLSFSRCSQVVWHGCTAASAAAAAVRFLVTPSLRPCRCSCCCSPSISRKRVSRMGTYLHNRRRESKGRKAEASWQARSFAKNKQLSAETFQTHHTTTHTWVTSHVQSSVDACSGPACCAQSNVLIAWGECLTQGERYDF